MNRRSVVRGLSCSGIVAVALSALACGGEKKPEAAESTKAAAAVATPAPATALPGAPNKPFDSLTIPELNQFLATLKWDTHSPQSRTCNSGQSCKAQLGAVQGQQEIAPAQADGNGYGTVVVQMHNLGGASSVEDMYKIKGGGYMYYMIAHKATDSSMSWTLHEVPPGQPAHLFSQGSWAGCPGYVHASTRPAESKFATCQKAHAVGDSTQGKKKRLDDPNDPAWMTCVDGCCTAGNPVMQSKKP